jgi:hypothetical protein
MEGIYMNNSKINSVIIILLIIAVLFVFSACRTIVVHSDDDDDDGGSRPPKKPKNGISKGDVITVRGRVERDGNNFYIHDVNSSNTFKMVGLSKGEKAALYKRQEDVIKIRIKIVSVGSKHFYNASVINIY